MKSTKKYNGNPMKSTEIKNKQNPITFNEHLIIQHNKSKQFYDPQWIKQLLNFDNAQKIRNVIKILNIFR